jgi:hypothetical protein
MDGPTGTKGEVPVSEYLGRLGFPSDAPHRPVVRSGKGLLVTIPVPTGPQRVEWRGLFLSEDRAESVGRRATKHHFSEAHGLEGISAELGDTLSEAAWAYLEQVEGLDTRLAGLQARAHAAPLDEVWRIGREAAKVRAHLGRAIVAVAELGRVQEASLPGLGETLAGVTGELERTEGLARGVEDAVSNFILLRNAEDANRLAAKANELGQTSNRIAELQNISNIRMLGITYLALIIAIVGAVVVIPNTGATILGMPSAAWVPGIWVDVILLILAVVPIVLVFSRPWVLRLLRGIGTYEFRAEEGMANLPEHADGAPGSGTGPSSR